MDLDHHSHKIDQRQRINGVLDGREVSGGRVFGDGESERREELVLGGLEDRVFEVSNKVDPLHELLL